MPWYRENNYPFVATQICEYGIAYCQYSFSVPKVITELFHLYMMVNYQDYFRALGFKETYFDHDQEQFNVQGIIDKIKETRKNGRVNIHI